MAMNKKDWQEMLPGDQELLAELRISVDLRGDVPRGYVRHIKTGTIYKLETWLEKLRQGLVDEADGIGDGDRR